MGKTLLAIAILFISLSLAPSTANSLEKKIYKTSGRLIKSNEDQAIKPSPKTEIAVGFADIVEELLPTVVNISALQDNNSDNLTGDDFLANLPKSPVFSDLKKQLEPKENEGRKKKIFSIGSGFLISKDGLVVTNNHVIEGASEITISTSDGNKYGAKIIGTDEKTDIALLQIKSNKIFKFAKFGDSNQARIGDWVIIIGNPYGLGGSVSIGIVSARSRSLNNSQEDELIQTDAAINRGNSGSPMFNLSGEVIGISSAIFSPSGGSVGIGFATPLASAQKIIQQLRERGEVVRGWIGISIQEVSEEIVDAMQIKEARGAFINEVVKNGPADKAGIMPADIILKFNAQEINQMKDLPKAVTNYPVDETATVTILRNGEEKTLKIKVEKLQEEQSKNPQEEILKQSIIKPAGRILGINLSQLNSANQASGLIVSDVSIKSQAAKKGVLVGDVITFVNQKPIKSFDDLVAEVDKAQDDERKLLIFIKRGNSKISLILNPEE